MASKLRTMGFYNKAIGVFWCLSLMMALLLIVQYDSYVRRQLRLSVARDARAVMGGCSANTLQTPVFKNKTVKQTVEEGKATKSQAAKRPNYFNVFRNVCLDPARNQGLQNRTTGGLHTDTIIVHLRAYDLSRSDTQKHDDVTTPRSTPHTQQ